MNIEVKPEFEGLMDTLVQAFDEPFADDSTIPSYFVCKLAREKVTVALSGLGGDEDFAGYERYLGLRLRGLYSRLIPSGLNVAFNRLAQTLPERADGHYTINHLKRFTRSAAAEPDAAYAGFLSILRPDLQKRLFSDNSSISDRLAACNEHLSSFFNSRQVTNSSDSLNRGLYTDFKTYLPEDILAVTDRMSMQHSLWLKTDLKPITEAILSSKNLHQHGLFNEATVRQVLDQHASGRENHDTLIWALVMFQRWFELYMQ